MISKTVHQRRLNFLGRGKIYKFIKCWKNTVTLKILKKTSEEQNQKISASASMVRLCPKDFIEEMTDVEKKIADKIDSIESGCTADSPKE